MLKDTKACRFPFLEEDYQTVLRYLQYLPSKLLVYGLLGTTDKFFKPH